MNYINHFRPIYEFRPLFVWPVAIVGILVSGMPYGWVFALVCLALLVVRGFQVWRALSFRMAISTKWLSKIHIGKLLATQKAMREREDSMYLGTGFEWTQKHTQIAHDILRMPVTDIPSLPRWLSKTEVGRAIETRIELLFAPNDSVRDRMPQGSSWIHGMEPKKVRVPFHYKAMGGHTLVGGTTGSGKDSHLRGHLHAGHLQPQGRADHRRSEERRRLEKARGEGMCAGRPEISVLQSGQAE